MNTYICYGGWLMAQHITSVNDLYERTQAMGYEPDGTDKIKENV